MANSGHDLSVVSVKGDLRLSACPSQSNKVRVFQAKPTFTIVAPSKLRPWSKYHVSVSVHDVPEKVQVDVALTESNNTKLTQRVTLDSAETQAVDFDVEAWGPGSYSLRCVGEGGLQFAKESPIEFDPKSFSVFIQTDKAIYKPGQVVQFRVLVVDSSLVPTMSEPANLHITDAKNNRIKQWHEVRPTNGIVSDQLQLSEEPILGDWMLHANISGQVVTKGFTVAEYVLPTFDVEVILPSYATYSNSKVIATIKSTYTYGKGVRGEVNLTVQPQQRYYYSEGQKEMYQVKVKTDGVVDIPVDMVKDLGLKDQYDRDFEFVAVMEESLTGKTYNKTGTLKLYQKPIKVELVKTSTTYKPGLRYLFYVKVVYQDDMPVTDDGLPIIVRYDFGYDSYETYKYSLELVPKNGLVKVDIETDKSDDNTMRLQAEYKNEKYYLESISAAQSVSNNYIQIALQEKQTIRVGKKVRFDIQATEPIDQLTFQVIGRGDILLCETVTGGESVHSYSITATQLMAPACRVLVYYVRPQNEEVVADAINFDVDGLFRTTCQLSTDVNNTKPGAKVNVQVKTIPGALVGVLGVDQSILLLKTGNDVTQNDVVGDISKYNGGKASEYPGGWRGRSIWWPGSTTAAEIFADSGVMLLTNALVQRQRNYGNIMFKGGIMERNMMLADAAPMSASLFGASTAVPEGFPTTPATQVRKSFPETWLWNLNTTGPDGIASFPSRIPDTITSWIVSAFAMDEKMGLGISPSTAKVTVFRPFFIKLSLPYSIMRGESIGIQVVVFNYFNKAQTAEVVMENEQNEFQFEETKDGQDSKSRRTTVDIPAQDGVTVVFTVTPRIVGSIDIKVTAATKSAGDAIIKKLLVKPEGQPQFFNKALLVDLRSKEISVFKREIIVNIPKIAVADSEIISISAIGDILGPSISNLDNLLQMPYGCGEQNMINFVPNIIVLDYLTRAERLEAKTKGKAIKNMESGYQRELTYKRDDGSFSAFGQSDKNGSTWLTAYVLKSFVQAKPYIAIDDTVIDVMIKFLIGKQSKGGDFIENGEVHHKDMQGGAGSGSGCASTAYVLIALLQDSTSMWKRYRPELEIAENFLVKCLSETTSMYDITLAAYALNLAESKSSKEAYAKMLSVAKKSADYIWWSSEDQTKDEKLQKPFESSHYHLANSNDVEMTAYAMLTAVFRNDIETAVPAMRWLIAKQNSNGGFSSTQDTVVGLQSLGNLAGKLSSPDLSIGVKATHNGGTEEMEITEGNALLLQRRYLPHDTQTVVVEASGRGAAVVQVSWQYNLNTQAEEMPFFVGTAVSRESTETFIKLDICTYYKAGTVSNMAVMEVDFPSGYVADVESLPRGNDSIKRVDTADGDTRVVIYFNKLTKDKICLSVSGHKVFQVSKQKPVPVTVYDYYNRLETSRVFYER